MENRQDDLTLFYLYINKQLETAEKKTAFPDYFFNSFRSGERIAYQKHLSETKHFDDEWIITLESYFPSIAKIVNNPRTSIRYDEEIVPIEKARKINSQSVRHLAAHTHFIRDVQDGQVIPKKILTHRAEVEIGIYENRFVMTLIDRLYAFVHNRYQVIRNNVESYQKTHTNYQASFDFNSASVELNVDMVIKKDLDDAFINEHNYSLLERVEQLRGQVLGFKKSPFMREMAGQRPVKPPLIKTNIILKNVDFNNAYLLWLFIDRYHTLGYDVEVEEKELPFDELYFYNLEQMALLIYSIITENQLNRKDIFDAKDSVKLMKKSTKVAKDHPADFVEDPDSLLMEDYSVNQYYLEKIKEVFSENIEKQKVGNVLTEAALKKAFRDTISITNALFDAQFDLEVEEDIFKRLVQEENFEEQLNIIKEKARVARIARQTKEIDYANAIRLEKRLNKEFELISNQAARKRALAKKRASKDALKAKLLVDREKDKIDAIAIQAEMDDELQKLTSQRKALQEEQKALRLKIKEMEKMIEAKEKERFEKEKAKMLAKEKAARDKIKAREQEKLKKMEARQRVRVYRVRQLIDDEVIKAKAFEKKLAKKKREYEKFN